MVVLVMVMVGVLGLCCFWRARVASQSISDCRNWTQAVDHELHRRGDQ